MATTRGNQDTIDQTQVRLMSGGSNASQLVTTDSSAKTIGGGGKWDVHGNWVDSGAPSGSTPILDSSGNPIFDSSGNWVFPG